jgi:colanic acid biosynthesis glycosyl transferase WcaI
MGRKQGLEVLLRAAARTADRRIQFILCGDGAERRELEKQAQSSGVRNVHLIPLLPEPRYRELLADADLCVIPQQPGSAQCFFPSKLLRALAFSRPILAITDAGSELAASVREGGFGRVVPPEDEAEIARVIETLAANPEELPALGRAGYKFVKRFDQRELLVAFTQELERIALRSSPHSKSGCPLNIAPV